jgi:uncharacterized protein
MADATGIAPRVWVLADDRAGNVSQALGVAGALGWPFEVKEIRYGRLARLPNRLLGATIAGLARASRAGLRPPWPEVVIGAGRRTVPVGRWIKRRTAGRCLLVQIMWPGSLAGLDLVAVPEHDAPPADARILVTPGAPHRVTRARLAAEAHAFLPRLEGRPRPYVACLVGGSSRHGPFTAADARRLAREAGALARAEGGTLLLTTSRRSGAAIERALVEALEMPAVVHLWGDPGPNPYLGMLGVADAVVVTGDSASMCSEAAATGRAVYLFTQAAGVPPKLARLHDSLVRRGRLEPLGAPLRRLSLEPLNPAQAIADAIRARLTPATADARDG